VERAARVKERNTHVWHVQNRDQKDCAKAGDRGDREDQDKQLKYSQLLIATDVRI
jgi:hypothetical protein